MLVYGDQHTGIGVRLFEVIRRVVFSVMLFVLTNSLWVGVRLYYRFKSVSLTPTACVSLSICVALNSEKEERGPPHWTESVLPTSLCSLGQSPILLERQMER